MTYLFDIGNVLLSFNFTPALESLKGPEAAPDALEKIIAAKDEFEAGRTQLSDYLPKVYQWLDFQGSAYDFSAAWNSIFTPIPETWALAETLKKEGHRLILFSNTNPIHAPFIVEEYPVFDLFDAAVFSHEIGAIKPEETFFTRAFEQFQIIPEETIYIDDLPENIGMGKQLGLHSFCYDYHNHSALLKWLDQQSFHASSS